MTLKVGDILELEWVQDDTIVVIRDRSGELLTSNYWFFDNILDHDDDIVDKFEFNININTVYITIGYLKV